MFELSASEIWALVSQNVLPSKSELGGDAPMAFTEQGIGNAKYRFKVGKKAIKVNITLMQAFVFLRQYTLTHKDLTEKLKEFESQYNQQFKYVSLITHLLFLQKLCAKSQSPKTGN